MMAQHLAPLALLLAPLLATANQPDVFFPHYEHGCGAAGCAVWQEVCLACLHGVVAALPSFL